MEMVMNEKEKLELRKKYMEMPDEEQGRFAFCSFGISFSSLSIFF